MPAGPPPDDLDVRLRWPVVDEAPLTAAPRRSRPRQTVAASEGDSRGTALDDQFDTSLGDASRSLSTELARAWPSLDSTQAALAAIALRLEALTNATALLRNSVNDRLTEYGEQALRTQSTSGRNLEDYQRLQDQALANIESGLTVSEEALYRLEASTAGAMAELDRLSGHFDVRMDRVQELVEEVAGRQALEASDLAPVLDGLEGLSERSTQLGAQLSTLLGRAEADMGPVHQALAGIEEVLEGLAQQPAAPSVDFSHLEAALARIEESLEVVARPPDSDDTAVHQALDDLHRAITEIAAGQTALGDDVTAMSKAQQSTTRSQLTALSALQDRLSAVGGAGEDRDVEPDIEAIVHDAVAEVAGRLDAATMAIADEVQTVTRSVDALRRRIAVRARSESTFNESAVNALADAVARRLSLPPAPSAPAAAPPRASARRRGTRA